MLSYSCRKDELTDPLENIFEENSGQEVVIVDSLRPSLPGAANQFVKGYFHISYELIKDTSVINNVIVFESSIFGTGIIPLHSNQRNYFIDINVSSNHDYAFAFALEDLNGGVSKKTASYIVHVP